MSLSPRRKRLGSPSKSARHGITSLNDSTLSSFQTPSYQRGTISSQSDDVNQQTYRIQRAFDANAWTSLKQIEHEKYLMEMFQGDALGTGYTNSETPDQMRVSIHSRVSLSKPVSGEVIRKKGYFSDFQYVEDPLELKVQKRRADHRDHMRKVLEMGRGKEWNPVKSLNVKDAEIYPHIPDPFEALENEQLRSQAIKRAKKLAGDFKLGGKTSSTVTRALFDDLLEDVYFKLESDWKDDLGAPSLWVERDLVLIFYTVPENLRPGLSAYMNLLPNDGALRKYQLTRVIKRWNKEVGGYILFTFRPPWVTLNETLLPEDIQLPKSLKPHSRNDSPIENETITPFMPRPLDDEYDDDYQEIQYELS